MLKFTTAELADIDLISKLFPGHLIFRELSKWIENNRPWKEIFNPLIFAYFKLIGMIELRLVIR
jgi:hypothetical protein